MDNNNMTLEELTQRIVSIKSLLDDPQPGLISWCMMLGAGMEELTQRWSGRPAKPDTPQPDPSSAQRHPSTATDRPDS